MKALARAAVALLLVACGASVARACTCSVQSTRAKFRRADAVFLGKVLEVGPNPVVEEGLEMYAYRVRFAVERRWKGAKGDEVEALAAYDRKGWCGDLGLAVGERFLIYAERGRGHLLVETDCAPSRPVNGAGEEMKKLGRFWFRLRARLLPF